MKFTISEEKEKQLIVDVLVKMDIARSDAQTVAKVLTAADLRGIKSHGLSRLWIYAKRLQDGLINKTPNIKLIKENKGTALFDGDNGLGHVASTIAMEKCIELAKKYGISAVGLGNSNHYGIAGYYSMMASRNDLIGFSATNTSPSMAPFGGIEAMFGTNPITVAVPADKEEDIILDMATSLVPRGKIEVYKRNGEKIPSNWGIDSDGNPTDDPAVALKGTLLPMGGYKGYGLALMVDVLSGVLTGSSYLNDVGSLFGDKVQNLGMIMMAIDVSNFMEISEFKQKIDGYIKTIKNSKKAQGTSEIYVAGEIEYNNTLKNRKDGISVDVALVEELRELAGSLGLSIDEYINQI